MPRNNLLSKNRICAWLANKPTPECAQQKQAQWSADSNGHLRLIAVSHHINIIPEHELERIKELIIGNLNWPHCEYSNNDIFDMHIAQRGTQNVFAVGNINVTDLLNLMLIKDS